MLLLEKGADYFVIGSVAYAECGFGDVEFSNNERCRTFGDWEVFFSPNGAIRSLRNENTGQWHGQSTGLQMVELMSDHHINPNALIPVGSKAAAYYGFKIETVLEYIISRIPTFVPFQSQSQYATT